MGEYHQESTANTDTLPGVLCCSCKEGKKGQGPRSGSSKSPPVYAARKPHVPVHLPSLPDTDRTRDFRGSSGPLLAETSAVLVARLPGGILLLNCCMMVSRPLHNNAPFVLLTQPHGAARQQAWMVNPTHPE